MSIGGTSGTGANTLSMNLGGVQLNYDLGPSVSTVFNQGLSFLNSRFNADQAFTGGAIIGANDLVSHLTSPLIDAALTQSKANNQELPSLFGQEISNNFTLAQDSIQTQADVANASIAASEASAQAASNAGGGFCYVTTAVCETLGLEDDCYTLQTLRKFRDEYLLKTNVGRSFVEEYYKTARTLCAKIRGRTDAQEYISRLYERFILPALLSIENDAKARAFKIYRQMIYTIREENP